MTTKTDKVLVEIYKIDEMEDSK
jgi:4-hydroxysphinganine ceramide fatty acyl 2-hydroxylase